MSDQCIAYITAVRPAHIENQKRTEGFIKCVALLSYCLTIFLQGHCEECSEGDLEMVEESTH